MGHEIWQVWKCVGYSSADLGAKQGILTEFCEYVPSGYLVLDFEGRILEANATAGTLLGVKRQTAAFNPLPIPAGGG